MPAPDPLLLLDHAATAYAWADGDSLVWGNRSFYSLVDTLQVVPEELIKRASDASRVAIPAQNALWHARVSDTPAGKLVEWIPSADSPRQASIDSLTGLLNRESIQNDFARRFERRHENPFVLVFADLDCFKQVNDRWGHLAGDRCLEQIGERLRRSVRSGDAVGRLGGDEFLILLSELSQDAELRPVLERLRDRVSQPLEVANNSLRIRVSLGAAYSIGRFASPEEMLSAADQAMYADKRTGPALPSDIADSAKLG